MSYTTTLQHTSISKKEEAGYRAMHLAKIAQASYPVPLSFIIPCSLYEAFVTESGIRSKLTEIYAKHTQTIEGYARAYKEVLALFQAINFSKILKESLLESYESLAIPSKEAGATDLVAEEKDPSIIIIPSPDYQIPEENLLGAQINITGKEQFLHAIKTCWASSFLPEQVLQRQYYTIEQFNIGLIIEQQQKAEAHAISFYQKNQPITVQSYAGYLDVVGEIPADKYSILTEHLQIRERTIYEQQYKLVPGASGTMEQLAIGSIGAKQILNDRQILEIARLTKRAHVVLEKNVQVHTTINGETTSILLVIEEQKGLTKTMTPSPEPQIKKEDEYIPVEQVPLQQSKKEEIIILEKETPSLEQDIINSSNENVIIYAQEPLIEPTPMNEHKLTQEKFIEEEDYVPPKKEETLFDMVTETDLHPGIAFIEKAMQILECEMVMRYMQYYNKNPEGYTDLIEKLREATLLPLDERTLRIMENWHERILQGMEPSDKAIGVAWRVLQQLG